MKKYIVKLVKSFIFAFVMLYTFNILLSNMNIFIPINIFTLSISTLLGPFGIISLVAITYML